MHLAGIFKSARGNRFGINKGSIDRLNLKTIRLYEDKESMPHLNAMLDDCIKHTGWIIFYTHGVESAYNADGCSPQFFEDVVKLVKARGLQIATVDEAMDKILEKRFELTH